MRATSLLLALALSACLQLEQGGPDAGVDAGSASDGATAGCTGLRDILGACHSVDCLLSDTCDPKVQGACGQGVLGEGTCVAGRCVYQQSIQGCATPAACPCGFCGADGVCYGDRSGTCGNCTQGSQPDAGTLPLPCVSCLEACQGTNGCCQGCGCICEPECGKCQ